MSSDRAKDAELDRFKDAVRALADQYAPGWELDFGESTLRPDGALDIELSHPCSAGVIIKVVWTQVEQHDLDYVRSALNSMTDIVDFRSAPPCRHSRAVKGVRTLALAHGWGKLEVASVAGLLCDLGALDEEEYEWLREHPGNTPTTTG
jgi:hypothetical protein